MATNVNAIRISPEDGSYLRREAQADAAGILPGHLMQKQANGKIAVHATADGADVEPLFAVESTGKAGTVNMQYEADEIVHYVSARVGSYIHARLASSQTVTKGASLASNGDGTLKVAASAPTGVIATAEEAVTTTTNPGWILVEVSKGA